MRKLRSTTALIALFVTVWSNLTAFPCGSPPPVPGGDVHADHTAPGHGHGAHHAAPTIAGGTQHGTHHGSHGTPTGGGEDERSPSDHFGQGCAVLMSCAAAARARSSSFVQAVLSPPVDDAPFASIPKPSAADRTQDPPPPRRHA